MNLTFTLEDIARQAEQFIVYLEDNKIAVFSGQMGAGKTTFIHAVCRQMKVIDKMSSPTFSIINQYKSAEGKLINHIDLYRLKDSEEAVQAGVEDAVNSGDLCFIEWPEKIMDILPSHIVNVFIEITGERSRRLIAKVT